MTTCTPPNPRLPNSRFARIEPVGRQTIRVQEVIMLLRILFLFAVLIVAVTFTHLLNMQKLRAMQNEGPATVETLAY